eukprot:Nitzschia sp. Nitz4//scaffold32_size149145//81247//83638//NITZ4_002884-RA/size149145-augustus-gene-0.51-mRNA-1//-1//CDS//3329548084//5868//frame0
MEVTKPGPTVDLYLLLKVDRNASEEEIHKAFKSLSTTFHPDKLPPTTTVQEREQIQLIFLEFKRANDILIDPVLRLTYDEFGEEGVTLVKELQQRYRERETRKDAQGQTTLPDDEDHDDHEQLGATLYHRLEKLLQHNKRDLAVQELRQFMEQHHYDEEMTEHNQVQLNCNMQFPPAVDLTTLFQAGQAHLQQFKRINVQRARGLPREERAEIQEFVMAEGRLLDYQINKIRDTQKATVGFTLSSLQPRTVINHTGEAVPPKWSMAMGASTDYVYPNVAEVAEMAGKKVGPQRHPASTFINTVYQPIPNSQINVTANLSNDQSHQFVLGTARTFVNRSSHRYSITYLAKSPLKTKFIWNFKSFRHIKDVGMASGGLSVGANGKVLGWNAKVEAMKGANKAHKLSAKVSAGAMQGNALELSYKLKCKKRTWYDQYLRLPKTIEATAVLSSFPRLEAMFTQDLTSLANDCALSFGLEHDISLGCWTWIWEWSYNDSTFRVPIPVLLLGSVADPVAYYAQKIYYAFYALLIQSSIADVLCEEDKSEDEKEALKARKNTTSALKNKKTKEEADQQLSLLQGASEQKRAVEVGNENGLVILEATYWLEGQDGVDTRMVTMDARVQLQFWVTNGRLSLPAVSKSTLLGFYDLETQLAGGSKSKQWQWQEWKRWIFPQASPVPMNAIPHLTVRYAYQGNTYEISILDSDALVLPNPNAECLGDSDVVS